MASVGYLQRERVTGTAGGFVRRFAPLVLPVGLSLLIAAPVVTLFRFLLLPDEGLWSHLAGTVLFEYVWNSFWLCVGVALCTGVIGAGSAWLVTMYRFPGRRLFAWALFLPLAMPAYVLAYAYTDLLQVTGPVQTLLRDLTGWGIRDYWFPEIHSLGGAVFVLSFALYPYVYALARAAFVEQSQCALEVSRTLGCNGWSAFGRVGLPLARPAVAAGLAFVLMETLADFGAVSFFGVQTFTTGIYRAWYALGRPSEAAQLASVLLLFVFALLMVERLLRSRRRFASSTTHIYRKRLPRLEGRRAVLAVIACLLPLAFGFLLPAGTLLTMAVVSSEGISAGRLEELVADTLLVSGLAAVLLASSALLALYSVGREQRSPAAFLVRFATLGYAVPGAVIGVGILIVVGKADRLLAALLESRELLLGGTLIVLLYGYLVRFFAVAYAPLEAGFAKIGSHLSDAARTLGHRPVQVFARVHFPLLRPSLVSALLLSFVDVMKELPATLILRPFDFNTLAVEAYRLATTERLEGAAIPSLLIVAAGLIPVILLCRMAESHGSRSAP